MNYYSNDKPCKNCGGHNRYLNGGACVNCASIRYEAKRQPQRDEQAARHTNTGNSAHVTVPEGDVFSTET